MRLIFLGEDCIQRIGGDAVNNIAGTTEVEETPETEGIEGYRIKLVSGVITILDYTPEEVEAKSNREFINLVLGKIGKAMFQHENRIRVLEGLAPITVEQFKAGIQAL